MNFTSLPTDAKSILAMRWDDYAPYFADLESRKLDSSTVDAWLTDWSTLSACIDEQFTRLQVLTSQFTADEDLQRQFDIFLDQVQPPAKTADQKLKEKFLASGLNPAGFENAQKMMRAEADLFRESNLSLLAEEQKLSNERQKLFGASTVQWEGEEKTIWEMMYGVMYNTDREVRERAWKLTSARLLQNREAVNELWEKFMAVRMQIADNAGKPDYRAYVWDQKFRFGYTPEDCKSFHDAIEQVVVPAAERVHERRRQKLGIDAIRPWDRLVDQFGRPALKPASTVAELNSKILNVFDQVDPIFKQYYQSMMDSDLLDLDSRKNKGGGAYSVGFNAMRQPFIFMSHANSATDVETLLHEGGHAFHTFESMHLRFHQKAEIYVPAEFAEVASMGMELLASPYLTKERGGFYTEEESARARIGHMEGIITFWPYMSVVDLFQHWVYENPTDGANPMKCDEKWGELWDRFMKGIDFSGFEDSKKTFWQIQSHIHGSPFYYVEYGLAQLGAVQVFGNARKNQKQAVADYRKALALGSTVPLPKLFSTAGAKFSFDAATLKTCVDLLEEEIADLQTKL